MNVLYAVLLLVLGIVGLLACYFLHVRSALVYYVRSKAIDLIHARNRLLINAGTCELVSWSDYENAASHTAMLFDLRKKKFEDFFPGLKEIA